MSFTNLVGLCATANSLTEGVEPGPMKNWGKLQFFIGPGSTPSVYELAVAHNPTKLVYDITSAHSFCYYESGPRDGKLGVMDEMKWIETAPAQAGIRV